MALTDQAVSHYKGILASIDDPMEKEEVLAGIRSAHSADNSHIVGSRDELRSMGQKTLGRVPADPNVAQNRGDFIPGVLRGIDTTQAMLYGGTALAGRGLKAVGLDSAGQAAMDWGLKGYQRNMAEAEKNPAKYSFRDVYTGEAGIGGAIDWAQGTLGELVPTMAEAAAGALIGSAIAPGPGTFTGAFAGRTVLKKSIDALTKKAVQAQIAKGLVKEGAEAAVEAQIKKQVTRQALKSLGGKVGMGAAVFPMEAGGMYAGLLEEHGVDAPGTALLFGAASTAMEYAGGNSKLIDGFIDALSKGSGGLVKKSAMEILKNIPEEAAQEAGQELMQVLHTVVNTDEKLLTADNLEQLVEAAGAGAVGGGAGAVMSGALSRRKAKPQEAAPQAKASDSEKILMGDEVGKAPEDILFDGDETTAEENYWKAQEQEILNQRGAQDFKTGLQSRDSMPMMDKHGNPVYADTDPFAKGQPVSGQQVEEQGPDSAQQAREARQREMEGIYSEPDRAANDGQAQQDKNIAEFRRLRSIEKSLAALERRQRDIKYPDDKNFQAGLKGRPDDSQMPLPADMPAFQRGMEAVGKDGKYMPFEGLDKRMRQGLQVVGTDQADYYDDGIEVSKDAAFEPTFNVDDYQFQKAMAENVSAQDLPARVQDLRSRVTELRNKKNLSKKNQNILSKLESQIDSISQGMTQDGAPFEVLSDQEIEQQRTQQIQQQGQEQFDQGIRGQGPQTDAEGRPLYADVNPFEQQRPAAKKAQEVISEKPASGPTLRDPKQQAFVDQRIEKLGSIEAVDKAYGRDDQVSKYARAKAREMFPETAPTIKDAFDPTTKKLKRTGTASKGDVSVKIVAMGEDGYGVETTVQGDRRLPTEKPMSLKEAQAFALQQLDNPRPSNQATTTEQKAALDKPLSNNEIDSMSQDELAARTKAEFPEIGLNSKGQTIYHHVIAPNKRMVDVEPGRTIMAPNSMDTIEKLYDAGKLNLLTPEEIATLDAKAESKKLAEGVSVSWKTKMGDTMRGTLINKHDTKPLWRVQKTDGKTTLVYEKDMAIESVPDIVEPSKKKGGLQKDLQKNNTPETLENKDLQKGKVEASTFEIPADTRNKAQAKAKREDQKKAEPQFIGKNTEGKNVYEDENGVRSYEDLPGLLSNQKVSLVPGGTSTFKNPQALYADHDLQFLTADEVKGFREEENPSISKKDPTGKGFKVGDKIQVDPEQYPFASKDAHEIESISSNGMIKVKGNPKEHFPEGFIKAEPIKQQSSKKAEEKQPDTKETPEKEDKQSTKYGTENKIFTADAAAKARETLRKKLSGNQLNSGIDPEILLAGIQLGGYHIEAGARTFAAYSKAMIEDVGDAVKPFLRSFYEGVRHYPGFNSEGMTPVQELDKSAEITDNIEKTTTQEPTNETDQREPGVQNLDQARDQEVSGDQRGRGRVPGDGENAAAVGSDRVLGEQLSEDVRGAETDGDTQADSMGADMQESGGGRQVQRERDAVPERKETRGEGVVDNGPGRGRDRGRERPRNNLVDETEAVAVPQNYHIKDPESIIGGTPKVRFKKNQSAIETYNTVANESRNPTAEERDAMAGYIGWGSFGQELFQGSWDKPIYKDGWQTENDWLREHLGEKAWKSAQSSIINAHYTDPITVSAVWDIAEKLGFKGGRVLEPSMGIGNFFGLMPKSLKAKSDLTGIELDETTAGMAKMLYPVANIQQMGYEKSKTADNFYDLVLGNWPFAAEGPTDRRYDKFRLPLHDYFFVKALDQVRPGGLVIGITASGSMDKIGKMARRQMAKRADLVGAFRMPTGAFKKYAGTAVVADIIVLQKRVEGAEVNHDAAWMDNAVLGKAADGKEININEYWTHKPDNVLGDMKIGHGTTQGREGMIVERKPGYEDVLKSLVDRLPKNIMTKRGQVDHISYVANNTQERQNSVTVSNGDLYVVQGERLAKLEDVHKYSVKNEKETAKRTEQLKALVNIRNRYGKLLDAERAGDEKTEGHRTILNKLYNAFIKQHGTINGSFALKHFTKAGDPMAPAMAALENNAGTKAKPIYKPARIFTESTQRQKVRIENPSISDAFVMARNETARTVDIDYIAEKAGVAPEKVKEELVKKDAIFETPAGTYEVKDIYLSGNVRQKLRDARDAQKQGLDMGRNIEALEKVIPDDIPYFNIEANLGATWIPAETYQQFIGEIANLPEDVAQGIRLTPSINGWIVKFDNPSSINSREEARTMWSAGGADFTRIIKSAFTGQNIVIKSVDLDGNEYVDTALSAQANEKVDAFKEAMQDWLWKDVDRRVSLERHYNETMNAWAIPKYDGSFLSFDGMMLKMGENEFDLRKHQVNAIWQGVANGRGLYAHEVGTGKTFTMGGIAVESRRYGLSKKPLIFAHNANSASVASDIQKMYPGAKVLYVDNLSPKTIDQKLYQIANDDWDAVVLPHSLVDRLTLSQETLNRLAQDEIMALEDEAISSAQDEGFDISEILNDEEELKKIRGATTAKELVKQRNTIIKNIEKQALRSSREGALLFEQLGVDMIIVDEAHEFKKPPITTRMKVKGLNTRASNQSISLNFLASYVRELNQGKGIHLFTGTPITNTLNEIYNHMRYFMYEEMDAAGVGSWDAWFNTFASVETDIERTATGEYEPISRLSKFNNVSELRRFAGQYMDIVFAEDMPEFEPRKTKSGKDNFAKDLTDAEREELLNGRVDEGPVIGRPYKKLINEVAEMSEEQRILLQRLVERAQSFKDATGKERREIMLSGDPRNPVIVETDAAKAGFDVRLFDKELNDHPTNKINRAVANVLKHYQEHPKAAQVIFMDTGYNDSAKRSAGRDSDGNKLYTTVQTFNAAKDIKAKLIAGGVNEAEIAIVNGPVSKQKRKEIADKVNAGKIRVVMGLTGTLGTGTNMQENLRAMHNLDAPWMPGELEQRNGRGHRQGNRWNTVIEYRYITEGIDARRWQVLAKKQKIIVDFLKAKDGVRTIEGDALDLTNKDLDEINASFSEAAGDARILVREKLRKDIEKLEKKKRTHGMGIVDAKAKIKSIGETELPALKAREKGVRSDIGAYQAVVGDPWEMTLDGKTYTKRQKANVAFEKLSLKLSRENLKQNEIKKIGEYRGFDIKVKGSLMLGNQYALERDSSYDIMPAVGSIDYITRNFENLLAKVEKQVAEKESALEKFQQVAKEPFAHEKTLENKKEALNQIEADLAANPDAPPSWLAQGAPIGTDVYYNGEAWEVEGHRNGEHGFYLLVKKDGQQEVIDYLEAMDENNLPIYEERQTAAGQEGEAQFSTTQDKAPGQGLNIKDIQRHFKGQKVSVAQDGSVSVKFGNGKGVTVKAVEQIDGEDIQAAIAAGRMGKDGKILGKYQDQTITLNKNLADTETLTHETLHMLKDFGILTPQEIRGLDTYRAKLVKEGKYRYQVLADAEENQANTLAQIIADRAAHRENGVLSRIAQKVMDFWRGLVKIATGKANAQGLAKAVETGKIYNRTVNGKQVKTRPAAYEAAAGKWYSALERGVQELKQSKAPAGQWMGMINKIPGLKQEELEWMGLEDWLKEQKGSIPKERIIEYLKENAVQVEEVVKGQEWGFQDTSGEWQDFETKEEAEAARLEEERWIEEESVNIEIDEDSDHIYAIDSEGAAIIEFWKEEDPDENGDDLWSSHWDYGIDPDKPYTYDDAVRKIENAAEDQKFMWEDNLDSEVRQTGRGSGVKYSDYTLPGGENYQELLLTLPEADGEYNSSHWDEPNVLAHVRFSERTVDGRKVLHIEEIQSDWHQEGRQKGYGDSQKWFAYNIGNDRETKTFSSEQELNRFLDSNLDWDALPEMDAIDSHSRVPNAPLKKSWPLTAFKRMVRYATENGFDTIAWTPGQAQADRYDLSKQVDRIEYDTFPSADGTKTKYDVTIFDKNKEQIPQYGLHPDLTSGNSWKLNVIEDVLGKEIAEKIRAGKGKKSRTHANRKTLSGLDLKVGGEGMTGFYDKILPAEVKKFFGKAAWGKPRMGQIDIGDKAEVYVVESFTDNLGKTAYKVVATHSGTQMEVFAKKDLAENYAKKLNDAEKLNYNTKDPVSIKLHAMEVTDKMKSKALREGMPVFQTAGDTNSAEFKAWFGKSAAKTKEGVPVPFYHGTPNTFTVFENRAGENTKHLASGLGHFFTMDKDYAHIYAKDGGNVMEVYLKMEKPYKMPLEEAQAFETLTDAVVKKRLLKLKKYDSVIIPIPGANPYIIVFDANQIKSVANRGTWDANNPDIRFSTSADAAIPAQQQESSYKQILSGLKNVFSNRKEKGPHYKEDIGVIENTMGLMSHYSEKVPALKRTFEELLKRPEYKFMKTNELSKIGEHSLMGDLADLQKQDKAAYKTLNDYLIDRDINQIGAVIYQAADGTWTVKSEMDDQGKRHVLADNLWSKKQARDVALDFELEAYPDAKGKEALRSFRVMTGKLHDFYAESWNEIIKEYEARGLELPQVVSRTKSGEVRIDLKAALAKMGERSSYYFPRQRSSGDWQVYAKKNGEHDFIEYRDFKGTADYLAGKLKAKGYAVEVKKVGSMSEDVYANIKNTLSTQAMVNQALAETKMETKTRDLKELGLRGEWRGDHYHLPNGGVYEWSTSVLKQLGGVEYSDLGKRGNSWSPGIKFDNAPKDIEELVINALYAAKGQETDVAFEIGKSLVNQLADTLRARGSRARMISRSDAIGQDVPVGYEEDALKAIAQAVNSAAGGYAKQQVAMETSKAITGQHYSWNEWQAQHDNYQHITAAEEALADLRDNTEGEEERIQDINKEIRQLQRERVGVQNESAKARQDRLYRIGKLFREKEKIRKWKNDGQAGRLHQRIARLRGEVHKEYRDYIQANMIDPKKQKRAYSDALNAVENVLKNDEAADRVINTMKGLASVWFLGGRLSSAAINLTAMGTTVPAAMNSYGSVPLHKTAKHIAQAGKAYMSFVTGKGKVSQADRAILEDIFSRGWVSAQLNMETVNALKSGPARGYSKAVEIMMTPFKVTEEFNRGATLLAAYKGIMAQNPGMAKESALQQAKTVSDRAHGIYGVENQPALLRKGRGLRAASTMYIFQTFMHNYFTTMAYMVGRKQAAAATYMILSPMVFGGAASSILVPAVQMIFKALGEDDPEEKIYDVAENLFGEKGDTVARYGLPGLAGVSLKGSLAPNMPDFKEPLDALGPIGGMMRNIYQGGVSLTKGDWLKGAEKLTPLAMGNLAKAYRETTEGVTTRSGEPVFFGREPIRGDMVTGMLRAAGMNPTKIAKPREIKWNETVLKGQYTERKRKIYNRIIRYHSQPAARKDTTEWQDIMMDIKAFNARIKSNGLVNVVPYITSRTIKNRIRMAFRPNKRERARAREQA